MNGKIPQSLKSVQEETRTVGLRYKISTCGLTDFKLPPKMLFLKSSKLIAKIGNTINSGILQIV
jgi:hypothetical protein